MRISLVSLSRPSARVLATSLGLSPSTASPRRQVFSPHQQLTLLSKDKFVNQNEARRILLECKARRDGGADLLSREMFRAVNETCDPPLALSVLSNLQSYGIPPPPLHLLSTSDRYSLRTLLSKIVLPSPFASPTAPHRVSSTNLSSFLSLADTWLPNDPFILLLALRGWDTRLVDGDGKEGDLLRRQDIEQQVMAAREGWFKQDGGVDELEGNGWHSLTEKESETILASVDELRRLNDSSRPPQDLLSSWDTQPRPASKLFHLQRILRLILPLQQTQTQSQSQSSLSLSTSPPPLLLPSAEISTFLLPPTLHHSYSSDPFLSLFTMYLYSLTVSPNSLESEGRNNFFRFRRELEGGVLGQEWHPDAARKVMGKMEGLEGGARWCLDEMLKKGLMRERERAAWEGCLRR